MFHLKSKINLSILVPIHNQEVTTLIHALHKQLFDHYLDWEIQLLEDGSSADFVCKNKKLEDLLNVSHHALPINQGRAVSRNILAQKAAFEFLLYLDADSGIPDSNFINIYAEKMPPSGVICGGRIYESTPPKDFQLLLHWKYGKFIESPASFKNFMSNNFLIQASIIKAYPFNEKIEGYGHEDTLLGQQLQADNIPIQFIHNPVIHLGLESADVFLKKNKNAVVNLKSLPVSTRLTRFKTFLPIKMMRILLPLIEKNLLSKNPSLFLFQMYKWIHFHSDN